MIAEETELRVRILEVRGKELLEQLLMHELPQWPTRLESKIGVHAQPRTVSRLQLDELETIHLDEVALRFEIREMEGVDDFFHTPAVQGEPGHEE